MNRIKAGNTKNCSAVVMFFEETEKSAGMNSNQIAKQPGAPNQPSLSTCFRPNF